MPFNKSVYDTHVNSPLTNLSVAYLQNDEVFAADKIFPTIPSQHLSDIYWEFPRGIMNRNSVQERAPNTESVGVGLNWVQKTYNLKMYSLHIDLSDPAVLNQGADAPSLDLIAQANMTLMNAWLINRETRFVSQFMTDPLPGNTWAYTANGAATATADASFNPQDNANNQVLRWSDQASDVIAQISRAKTTMQLGGGFRPNVMVMSREVFEKLKLHPQFVNRVDRGQTPGGAARVNLQVMKDLFELDDIYIMDAQSSTGVTDANGNETHTFIAPKNALLAYRANTPGKLTASAGYNFLWTDFTNINNGVKSIRIDTKMTTRYEINFSEAFHLVSKNLGYLFTDIVV